MFHIALFEPEIPPNTGNLIRLCANTGFHLHLIEPLGFSMSERALRRAGLDYHEAANVITHPNAEQFLLQRTGRVFACSTKGDKRYDQPNYQTGDAFMFGPESRGLPNSLLQHDAMTNVVTIPMQEGSRSLNLSNSVAIIAFEAWRQLDFCQIEAD